jgi:lipopolysaccharide transport system ATP-binding protein
MRDVAIKVEGLSKRYAIAAARYRHDSLRDHLMDGLKSLYTSRSRRPDQDVPCSASRDAFWALKDVSFELRAGEVLGLVGRNGAGKSTLLKILSRITEPTAGRAEIHGRVGSLLEVGTGFDRELTGRENIYLSGAILGMRKAEIDRKFEEIVAFSEVEKFIDTPVKRYSSGMYVRLAFAVAAHLEPEILLVDEVLAVGDAAFQRKCLGKMDLVTKQGRTIVFVSHNMAAVSRLCARALWLDQGRVKQLSSPEEVVAAYLASTAQEVPHVSFRERLEQAPGSDTVRLLEVGVRTADGQYASSLDGRAPFTIEVTYEILKKTSNLRIGCRLISPDGTIVIQTNDMDTREQDRDRLPGTYVGRCTLPGQFFNFGRYYVSVGSDTPLLRSHFFLDKGVAIQIEQTGGPGSHYSDGRQGLVRLPLDWDVRKVA